MKLIKNATVYGKRVDIAVENGKITAVGQLDGEGLDLQGKRLYPGLIDTHLHGCIGYDVSDKEDHLSEMADYLLSRGTTAWCPTTMTVSKDDIIAACNRDTKLGHGAEIIGFHLEGPFINPKKKGAQNANFIFRPDVSLLDSCKNAVKITIAPELPGSKAFIEAARDRVLISLGHSEADYDTAKGAFRAGVRSLTHTFNAMEGIHHRAPGPILAAAETDGVYAELIADGKHIHPAVMRMLIKQFGEDRIILISDSIRALGMPDGEYDLGGIGVTITNGTAYTPDMHLAGSTACLFDCVRTLIGCGTDADTAVKMASEVPARSLGIKKGKIEVGYDADFIIVDEDFNLQMTIVGGRF